jgi:hypothetical protein
VPRVKPSIERAKCFMLLPPVHTDSEYTGKRIINLWALGANPVLLRSAVEGHHPTDWEMSQFFCGFLLPDATGLTDRRVNHTL